MITLNLNDGRMIRMRQLHLGGSVILSLLDAPEPDSYVRPVKKEIVLNPDEVDRITDAILAEFKDAETNGRKIFVEENCL